MTSSRVLLTLGLLLGGCGSPGPGGTRTPFCDRMEAGTDHLRTSLASCPEAGDSAIYGFSRQSCESEAPSACSSLERRMLEETAACDLRIVPCASAADRSRVVAAVNACATAASLPDGGSVSLSCANAIAR